MRVCIRIAFIAACALPALVPGVAAAQTRSPLDRGVFEALNQLRANPSSYVAVLEEKRRYFRGNRIEIPGQPDLITHEGVRPLDEAIRFLAPMHSGLTRLTLSTGLSNAAADHVRDSGGLGLIGHNGSDGSSFETRLRRYGSWYGEIGEDISYGPDAAREVISELLIDDGVPGRGHRKSLVNPAWNFVGIACGPHSRYGVMCVIDFAATYRDAALQPR